MSKVAVVGGCGRTGFRFSLVAANKGHHVVSIDLDEEKIYEIKQGNLPFIEKDGELYLEQALKKRLLTVTSDYKPIEKSEIVVIAVSTPVDSNLNPGLEPVAGVVFDIAPYLKENQLIIFRSILSPAVIERIKILIEDKTGFKIGKNLTLAFAPEVQDENSNIHLLANSNQPVGAYDEASYKAAEDFFKTITKGKISWLTPEEAMLSKLMKNMHSYIQNATANEFYLIAESYKANIHKILDAVQWKLPNPNPNSSGPGTHKEGWFLVDRIPFGELITTAFKINESMPALIIQKLENYKINKVAILGMSNWADSDDYRSSLSYKLRKLLYYKNYTVGCYDPYLPEYSDSSVIHKSDAVILMTPHKDFEDINRIKEIVKNPNCIYIDLKGFWKETYEKGVNGIWQAKEGKIKK